MSLSPRLLTLRTLLLASAFLLPALSLRAEDSAAVTLRAKDAGKTFDLKVGSTLVVRLSAQMGTGYRWHLDAPALDAKVLAQEGEAKAEPEAGETAGDKAKSIPGGAEMQVFRFKALAPGKAELKFQYFREFEPDKKPLRTLTFHVRVLEAKG